MAKKALYLAGGGARGAYQAGVLKAIQHILQVKVLPFDIVSGVSIGSINAATLASYADDFEAGIDKLETLWRQIHCHKIFVTSNYQLGKSVFRNLGNFIIKQRKSGHLLDTTPLHSFIADNIDFDLIKENINKKHIEVMEVISNCYESQQTTSFYQHSEKNHQDWEFPRHVSKQVELSMEHILASSALPLFFPAIKINDFHFGDGSIGLVSPLRGAVRFEAEKILIIGTRQIPKLPNGHAQKNGEIGFAQVLGNMLNGLFLDNLDRDIEMLNRMNDIAKLLSIWKKRYSPWRPIQTMHLRPSINVSEIAQSQYQSMPKFLRVMLNVLGAQSHSGDLLSFLLFEREFTGEIIDLGYHDTLANAPLVNKFFAD